MPKRRVRTAAQVAASRRNLVKARKAKSRNDYSGKISVYHRTSHESANSILKNGFSTVNPRKGQKAEAFFSTKLHSGLTRTYGPAVIKTKLAPSTIRRYAWTYKPSFSSGNWYGLPVGYVPKSKLKRKLVTVTERKPKGRR